MAAILTTYKSCEPDPPCKKLAKKAAKKLQSFARRRWQHQRQSPLVRSAVANPFWRPIEVGDWTEMRSGMPPKWLEDKPFRLQMALVFSAGIGLVSWGGNFRFWWLM